MTDRERYVDQLRTQLGLLELHCRSFDEGSRIAALHIAVVIRVLLHDTGKSTSLLTHLDAKNINLLSTTEPIDTSGRITYLNTPMTKTVAYSYRAPQILPLLGEADSQRFGPAVSWWEEPIDMHSGKPIARKDIVLKTANKGGGAHVDLDFGPWLFDKSVGTWTHGFTDQEGQAVEQKIPNEHFANLRHMAFELLRSDELLNLVGYTVTSFAENGLTIQKTKRETAGSKFKKTLTVAGALFQEGRVDESRDLIDAIIEALHGTEDPQELALLLTAYWSKTGTYPEAEKAQQLLVYNEALSCLTDRSQLSDASFGVVTKIWFHKGMLHAQLGDQASVKECFSRSARMATAFLHETDPASRLLLFEPIAYALQSHYNLITRSIQAGDLAKALEFSTAFETVLRVVAGSDWMLLNFSEDIKADTERIIVGTIADWFHVTCILYRDLGRRADCVRFYKDFVRRSGGVRSVILDQRIQEWRGRLHPDA